MVRACSYTGDDRLMGLRVQPDGKIVGAGFTWEPTTDMASIELQRFNADGSDDNTFGVIGCSVPHFEIGITERAMALDLQSDGKLVVAGYNGNFDMFLSRIDANGYADNPGFGLGGYQVLHIGAPTDQTLAYGVVVQPDGTIVAAGYNAAAAKQDFATARFTSTGALDTTF